MTSISYAYRIGHNTVSKIISETCEAIWNAFECYCTTSALFTLNIAPEPKKEGSTHTYVTMYMCECAIRSNNVQKIVKRIKNGGSSVIGRRVDTPGTRVSRYAPWDGTLTSMSLDYEYGPISHWYDRNHIT